MTTIQQMHDLETSSNLRNNSALPRLKKLGVKNRVNLQRQSAPEIKVETSLEIEPKLSVQTEGKSSSSR